MTQTNGADIEAARLLLARLGVSVADLLATAAPPTAVPTFAEYVPIVSPAVGAGTRRVYSSYWNRLVEHWGARHLDEPTPTEIRQLTEALKTALIVRRNARGGRSATEHFIAALRCVYTNAENDGLINPGTNPALKVAKPRRLTSTRQAIPDAQLAEINQIAATTGNDPCPRQPHPQTPHRNRLPARRRARPDSQRSGRRPMPNPAQREGRDSPLATRLPHAPSRSNE